MRAQCRSRCYMIRERDGAAIVYRCFRERGQCKGRRHANGLGIGDGPGSWSTREGLSSLPYLLRDLVVTLPRRFRKADR